MSSFVLEVSCMVCFSPRAMCSQFCSLLLNECLSFSLSRILQPRVMQVSSLDSSMYPHTVVPLSWTPKGRGGATGYDTAVALPAAGDDEEYAKENSKSTAQASVVASFLH